MANKKKKVRVRRSRNATVKAEEFKPTLDIKGSQLGGKDLDVGKTVEVVVTGKVMREEIKLYGPDKGVKSYMIEVTKVRMA